MDSSDQFNRHPACICDSSHLFIILSICKGPGYFIGEVQSRTDEKGWRGLFEEGWDFLGNGVFEFDFEVLPDLVQHLGQLVFEQWAVSETHLVHIPVDVEHFHGGLALPDLKELAMCMGL